MSRLPPLPDLEWRPELDWQEGAPFARDAGDVYYSGDGLEEKRAVFLAGCGLPQRWTGRDAFTVGELGFGAGLAFLALWEMWRGARPSPHARLNVVSFERALMSASDAARTLARWPELGPLTARLLAAWPARARGVQQLAFPDDGVRLTLHIDDAASALPQTRIAAGPEGGVDAWFLDGFSPAVNPAMWDAPTLSEVARLSAPGARAATYSAAGAVRRGLEAAGFAVQKAPGYGRKKERLLASFPEPPIAATTAYSRLRPRRIGVVGAGVAGACVARAFLDRGCEVVVFDAADRPGAGASGNPLALMTPRLDAADGPAARALVEAYLAARSLYRTLPPEAAAWAEAHQRAPDAAEAARQARVMADPPLDDSLLRQLPAGDGDRPPALVFRNAMILRPALALPALLEGARFEPGRAVSAGTLADLAPLGVDLVVLCAGMGLASLAADLPLAPRMGQLEWLERQERASASAIADGGYLAQAWDQIVFGATFEAPPAEGPRTSDAARAHNLAVYRRLSGRELCSDEIARLESRVAVRATTPDRLPFAGWRDGDAAAPVMCVGGLGARGWMWAPLLAQLTAALALGEPLPVEQRVAEALSPQRFARRAARRAGGS